MMNYMPRFHVSFFKEVTSDAGQDVDAIQAALDIDAVDEAAAIVAAKEAFCLERGIRDWLSMQNASRLKRAPAMSIHPTRPGSPLRNAGRPNRLARVVEERFIHLQCLHHDLLVRSLRGAMVVAESSPPH
jgi:hypothetical protein